MSDEHLYVVIVKVDEACYRHGHRPDPLPDHVICVSCSQIASASSGCAAHTLSADSVAFVENDL